MSYLIYHKNLRRIFREGDILIAILSIAKNKAALAMTSGIQSVQKVWHNILVFNNKDSKCLLSNR